jgi:hypothetical protein
LQSLPLRRDIAKKYEADMNIRIVAAILLATWSALCAAQGTVYESKDNAGRPVYSDQPSPGAKPIQVSPPNLIQGLPPQAPAPAAVALAPYYASLAIASPADGDTIHTNTGEFDISVEAFPALRAANGDRIRVKLDGTMLASSYQSGNISLTESDWQAAAENVEHTLQAAIIDSRGAVLIESAPVKIFVHRASRLLPRR